MCALRQSCPNHDTTLYCKYVQLAHSAAYLADGAYTIEYIGARASRCSSAGGAVTATSRPLRGYLTIYLTYYLPRYLPYLLANALAGLGGGQARDASAVAVEP